MNEAPRYAIINPFSPQEYAERVRLLFDAVIELDPDNRAAYLDQACRDDADLRCEVGSSESWAG